MKKFMLLALLTLGACATPVLVSQGPQWQLKGACELRAKTTDWYNTTQPEIKCGPVLEVIIVKGGR